MSAFSGTIAGLGQAVHERNLLELQDKAQTHSAMLGIAQQLATAPGTDPDLAAQYHQLALQIATTPTMKFDPKKFDLQAPLINYAKQRQGQPQPQPIAPPGTPNPAGAPQGGGDMNPGIDIGMGSAPTAIPPPPGTSPATGQLTGQMAPFATPPFLGDPGTWAGVDPRRAAAVKMQIDQANKENEWQARLHEAIGTKQFDLQQKQEGLKRLMGEEGSQQRREWDALPAPIRAAYHAEAAGMAAAPMAGAMSFPHLISNNSLGESAPPGTMEYGTNEPVKKGERYRVMMMPLTGEEIWQRLAPNTIVTPTATGTQITNKYSGQAVAPIENSIPPAALLPTTSTSTQTSPGAAPVTTSTTRQKVIPGAAPPRVPAPPSGSGQGGTRSQSSLPAGLRLKAQQVASGDIPLPAGRDGDAIAQILAEQGKQIPTPLSAVGAQNIQAVDAVNAEIDDIDKALGQLKGDENLRKYYIMYKLGKSTPYDELFTKLSFEGLRSAAAALKGNNSRAFPIINRAFQHVPNLDRAGGLLPDDIPLIKDKLSAMRKVLGQARQTVLQDERKSGVPMPSMAAPPGSKVKVISPEGVPGEIPSEKLDEALKRGFKQVQ